MKKLSDDEVYVVRIEAHIPLKNVLLLGFCIKTAYNMFKKLQVRFGVGVTVGFLTDGNG